MKVQNRQRWNAAPWVEKRKVTSHCQGYLSKEKQRDAGQRKVLRVIKRTGIWEEGRLAGTAWTLAWGSDLLEACWSWQRAKCPLRRLGAVWADKKVMAFPDKQRPTLQGFWRMDECLRGQSLAWAEPALPFAGGRPDNKYLIQQCCREKVRELISL